MTTRSRVTILCVIWFMLLITHMAAFSQEDMEEVDNSVFSNPMRPPAMFFHDAHNEAAGIEDCSECHHFYENGELMQGESSEDMSCSECHEPVRFGKGMTLMKAFHKNCTGCHLKVRKGPILCAECHKKR